MLKAFLLFSLLVSFPRITMAQTETLTFGVVPQQSPERLAKLWTPIIQRISDISGVDIKFTTARDIPTFEERLAAGEYDIAYMNPYHYVVFSKKPGYEAIAKQQDKTIKGVIVAKVGSGIKTIDDLDNTRLAFPAPAAFAATILPRAELKRHGISYTPMYVSSHDSVYLNVSKGFFPAGGGIMRTLNNMQENVTSQLITIWETQDYTPHAIAVHPTFNEHLKHKILDALIVLNHDEQGRDLLRTINFKGFEAAVNHDWDDVRSLELETLMGSN